MRRHLIISGPKQVFHLSQDDKARVPLGIPVLKKQAPILMHMEYRISLPDHDWIKAERRKLIPSVYAGLVLKENGWGNPAALTYSGPTVIINRSGKHDKSCALSHAIDLQFVLDHDDFKPLCRTETGEVKPVVMSSQSMGGRMKIHDMRK